MLVSLYLFHPTSPWDYTLDVENLQVESNMEHVKRMELSVNA